MKMFYFLAFFICQLKYKRSDIICGKLRKKLAFENIVLWQFLRRRFIVNLTNFIIKRY